MRDTAEVERAHGDTDPATFEQLAERYREEIQLHCYRMLGSIHDAEDAVQDTLLRAWRGLGGFEGRSSLRGWLYRIATNACLTALARGAEARRLLPDAKGPPVEFSPLGAPDTETAWLEPYPDAALESVADLAPGPEARYEQREAVQLAFVAAIQKLPPRQRAVLLLRDVLGFSAIETADLLESSVASVNSALQRARATLDRTSAAAPAVEPISDERVRALLDRYVRTWESTDLDGFVALLREDAVWTMPPWPQWYVGRHAIRAFMGWVWRPGSVTRHRLVPTAANGRAAFGYYRSAGASADWLPYALQLVELRGEAIASVTNFVDPRLFAPFRLPSVLPSGSKTAADR